MTLEEDKLVFASSKLTVLRVRTKSLIEFASFPEGLINRFMNSYIYVSLSISKLVVLETQSGILAKQSERDLNGRFL